MVSHQTTASAKNVGDSPKRFTALAQQYKLRPGFAVDLCETKENGEYWNLNKTADVELLHELIDREEPLLITGSPPCHFFSKTHWTHLSDTFCSSRFLWISPRSFNRIIRPRISSSIPATRVRTRHGLPRSLDNVATPIKISNFMWYTSSNWLYKITKTNVTIVWFESKTKPKS